MAKIRVVEVFYGALPKVSYRAPVLLAASWSETGQRELSKKTVAGYLFAVRGGHTGEKFYVGKAVKKTEAPSEDEAPARKVWRTVVYSVAATQCPAPL